MKRIVIVIVILCVIVFVGVYFLSIRNEVSNQNVVTLPDRSEQKAVVDSGISTLYTDEQLLEYANDHIEDYWHVYYGFMTGTYFDRGEELNGYYKIVSSDIHSLEDIENEWYTYFSRRYPIPYMDMSMNPYEDVPFKVIDGEVYEKYCIDGFVGTSIYFDHITQKSDDEVWFEMYFRYADNKIGDSHQQYSFVYEDGYFKYGEIIKDS